MRQHIKELGGTPRSEVVMRWLILALCGAAICTVCDHLHATHGVLWYTAPVVWDQAWWVPLLFAGASLAAVAGATPIRRLFGAPRRRRRRRCARSRRRDRVLVAYAYYLVRRRRTIGPNVTLAVLVGPGGCACVRDRAPWLIAYSLAMALAGSAFEASLVGARLLPLSPPRRGRRAALAAGDLSARRAGRAGRSSARCEAPIE